MKRQILIRGAAIAFAGVAASVFAAQQFMAPAPQAGQVATPGGSTQVTGASLVGASGPTAPQAQTEAELAFDALEPPVGMLETAETIADRPDADRPVEQVAALDNQMTPARTQAPTDDFQPHLTLAQSAPPTEDAGCLPTIAAQAAIDALVDLRVTAPCAPNTRIVISHGDLAFSAYTDETGTFAAYVPALSMTANIEAFLPDQDVLQAQAVVPDAGQHVRVIVQWTGMDGVILHAYHRGASYGQAGHIHASRPFDPEMDAAFVLSLGEARGPEPMLTQIYSVPANMVDQARLELELAVTPQNCGQDMTAYVAKIWSGQSEALEELTVAMPDCGTDGGMAIIPLPLGASMQAQLGTTPSLALTQN